jgi:hypothetical protein
MPILLRRGLKHGQRTFSRLKLFINFLPHTRVNLISAAPLMRLLHQAEEGPELMGVMVKKTDSKTRLSFELTAHRYKNGSLIITLSQPFHHWN